MCNLTDKIKDKTFTVYKVAREVDGRYYSPATGIEYTVGPVPVPKKQGSLSVQSGQRGLFFFKNVLDPAEAYFNPNMIGRTAGFIHPWDAQKEITHLKSYVFNVKFVILKMILSEDLMRGHYGGDPVVAGKHIDEIELYES